ncbi:MAG: TonB-dependent receptor [Bacteroidetes bacterium]|nr:TonB-dependent receptor [Bacteroidota bacterium]
MRFCVLIAIIALFAPGILVAQQHPGTITGEILSEGKPVPFVNVGITELATGSTTDEQGKFSINNIPSGTYHLKASFVGYETVVKKITISGERPSITIKIEIRPLPELLNEVVVTGTRTEKRRIDVAVPVNILSAAAMQSTQSLNLSEALNYQPGIRIEKDCQTCNYSQVRMNGMGGSYSQILINSRPLFSSLAGLYGLEQLPAAMIDRVEIVKGGGSALYGSNAIAGVINIIIKDPVDNSYEIGSTYSVIEKNTNDLQHDLYASLVSKNKKSGANMIVSLRDRQAWDANGDGFSELASLENTAASVNAFHRISTDSKIRLSLNGIHEIRNGGDQLNREPHNRQQSEFRDAKIGAANIDFTHDFYEKRTSLSVYTGAQITDRKHYTGTFGSDGYGITNNHTIVCGAQLSHDVLNFISGKNKISLGFEFQKDDILDKIPVYNYLIDQKTFQTGTYLQSDWDLHRKINLISGVRISTHNLSDELEVSPRINLLYKITSRLQFRISGSTGFRAPQAFDSDLHIAFSGGGIALTTIDPNLIPEKSVSYSGSLDYNYGTSNYIYGFTVSSFYTSLANTFILEEIESSQQETALFRTNGDGAIVQGATFEVRGNYNYKIEGDAGLTVQKSRYQSSLFWSNEVEGTKSFLRTPEVYGYFSLTLQPFKKLKTGVSGIYTGTMLAPHFAGAPGVLKDELVQTRDFLELNFKIEYTGIFTARALQFKLGAGIQNITNAFQQDFDSGPNRDSNYMYGPGRPRTYFLSLRLSKLP